MSRVRICNYCINKTACDSCDKDGWLDKFIPNENVKKYFRNCYNGARGYDGKRTWDFETTNPDLVETHSVEIDGSYYCPYCGEEMFPIQTNISKYNDYSVTGHCCICEGARTELEYEKEKECLEEKHESELNDLKKKYIDLLKFDSEKLFEIKQEKERKNFNFFSHDYSHLTIYNGDKVTDIKQII